MIVTTKGRALIATKMMAATAAARKQMMVRMRVI